MTERFIIIAAPAFDRDGERQLHGKFDARYAGRLLVAATRQPFLDGCRELLKLGVNPNATAVMKHLGSETESLRARIGDAAKLTVKEPDYGKATFARWQPYEPSSPVEAPSAKKRSEVLRHPKVGEAAE